MNKILEKKKDYINKLLTNSEYDIEEQKQVINTLIKYNTDMEQVRVEWVKWPSFSIHRYYIGEKLIAKIYDGEITWMW